MKRKPKVRKGLLTLSYTVDDDGIWLDCTCDWKVNLGFFPSPSDVNRAVAWHDKQGCQEEPQKAKTPS
jgi:hypothetical protein